MVARWSNIAKGGHSSGLAAIRHLGRRWPFDKLRTGVVGAWESRGRILPRLMFRSPARRGGYATTRSQPLRYSRWMNLDASGALVALSDFASHSSALPVRYATLPSSTASLRA